MTVASLDTRPLVWVIALALIGCAVTILSGMAAALTYTGFEPILRSFGFTLQHFRAVHDAFAFGWVFLGGAAVVYFYLYRQYGEPSAAARKRIVWNVILWTAAGVGIVATLLSGRFSGREYLGYHPFFSLLIIAGWFLFARNYFERSRRLKGRPVYIYMWTVGILLFFITYIEGHLYLLDALSDRPIRDMAIQWKSAGTMVGSFNQIVYGSCMYIACCIKGDDDYAYSRPAFALLWVGLLNTFANYGHHTYHLPQSAWIHWISFVVSMLEIIILAKVLLDLLSLRKSSTATNDHRISDSFLRSTTGWVFLMLTLSLLISVPPLNALIHGTHVVVAHSMGSMLGIDSMILWAAFSYLLWYLVGAAHPVVSGARVRLAIPFINIFLVIFWFAYLIRGLAAGWIRYFGPSAPDFSVLIEDTFPLVMVASGFGLALAVLWMLAHWLVALGPLSRAAPVTAARSAVLVGTGRPNEPVTAIASEASGEKSDYRL